ncbi:MAG: 50S ribosomal protein L10 [Synergistaceae bacterium]|jgi:large subunit ribosomal protein L10|nr:50S ribosomal protein L10 [Synergistaceae bacterium]
MPTEVKRKEIDELAQKAKSSEAIFITEYRGLTVSKSTAVRKAIRATNGDMRVTKNTLMRIALRESGIPTADDIDAGPNAYVFAFSDVAATARALRDFAKERGNEALVIKGGIMGGKIISKDQVLALADLPSREVLLSQLLGVMNGPMRSFVTVLSGPARGFVTVLTQIKEQKEKAA